MQTFYLSMVFNALLFGLLVAPVATATPIPFNRLLVPPDKRIPLLKDDGIHDSESPAMGILQEPKDGIKPLEKTTGGNIDWMQSLKKGTIKPLYDRNDPSKQPMPMDLDIVMQVKGSMPDVLFPHAAHLEWLDCANCHPQVFVPKKGGNQFSMAQIMLGQSCGVCHGAVAFPIMECRKCHSQPKKPPEKAAKKK